MKSKEERLAEIRSAIINAGMSNSTKNIVFEFFDGKYKKQFEEASDEVLEIFEFVLHQLGAANNKYVIFLNEIVSIGLRRHELRGNWVQLSQIHRSLSDQIVDSLRDEDQKIKDLIIPSIQLEKDFEALDFETKKKIMEKKS